MRSNRFLTFLKAEPLAAALLPLTLWCLVDTVLMLLATTSAESPSLLYTLMGWLAADSARLIPVSIIAFLLLAVLQFLLSLTTEHKPLALIPLTPPLVWLILDLLLLLNIYGMKPTLLPNIHILLAAIYGIPILAMLLGSLVGRLVAMACRRLMQERS